MTRVLWFTVVIGLASAAMAYDLSTLSAGSRADQPVPTGHQVGKDNGDPEGGLHYAGDDCGTCHTPGGKAEKFVFTMSGTLYEDRLGSTPLVGAEIILEDVAGNILSMTTNEAGNFWTETPIASNPTTIASHSGTTALLYQHGEDGTLVPAPEDDSRTWLYKAWIRNGDQAISMITVAPVGGSTGTTPRMSCGMHHSPLGSTGAAWVARIPALTDYPDEDISFKNTVQPILAAKCAPCHVPGAHMTRLVTESDINPEVSGELTQIDYSGELDLTSYQGYTTMVGDLAIVKDGVYDVVDPANPEESDLLVEPKIRPLGSKVVHPSGGFWTPDDPDYRVIRQWIAEGAQDN